MNLCWVSIRYNTVCVHLGDDLTPTFNSVAPGKFEWNFRHVIFKKFSDWWLRHLLWNCPNRNDTGLHWWPVNIGTGNGLVPPYCVTRSQWVHSSWPSDTIWQHSWIYGQLTQKKYKKINNCLELDCMLSLKFNICNYYNLCPLKTVSI